MALNIVNIKKSISDPINKNVTCIIYGTCPDCGKIVIATIDDVQTVVKTSGDQGYHWPDDCPHRGCPSNCPES